MNEDKFTCSYISYTLTVQVFRKMPVLTSRWNSVTYPEDISITDYVLEGAAQYGNKIALVEGSTDESLTFNQVVRCVKNIGSYLRKHGVQKNDVVILFLGNNIYYPVLFHAIAGIGAIASPCNPLSVSTELAKQMENSKAKFIFTQTHLNKTVSSASHIYGQMKSIWILGDSRWDEMLSDDGSAWPKEPVVTNPGEEVAMLPFSSGTTGLPKGVMISHLNLVAHEAIVSHPGLNMGGEDDVYVFPMPMFHIYGTFAIFIHALRSGVKVVSMTKFNPETWLRLIEKHKVTILHIVPPIAVLLAKNPIVDNYDLSSVQDLFCGAAPLGGDTQRQLESRLRTVRIYQGAFPTDADADADADDMYPMLIRSTSMGTTIELNMGYIGIGYGMTETSGLLLIQPHDDRSVGTAGSVTPNTKAKVIDTVTGEELGANADGELCFCGPQVMLGYFNNPEATARTVKDGWIHTGDIGHYNENGLFFVVDRLKELIKYKGFQVAPAELENLILTHPAIADTCVVGVPDEESGELPKAFCVKKSGHEDVTAAEIVQYVSERCEIHKKLRGGVEFIAEIPKTASGKLLRRTLRDRAKMQHKM